MSGWLALIGGAEWRPGCSFDRTLLDASAGAEVLILPTAAAYEHPERAVETAERYFEGLGAKARGLMVLSRGDAEQRDNVDAVRESRFLYLAGGSPMHLRSVLKDSALWDALVAAWHDGAVLAGSSAGAMVLCDPMVDPRGGPSPSGWPWWPRWRSSLTTTSGRRTRRAARSSWPLAACRSWPSTSRPPSCAAPRGTGRSRAPGR